MKRNLVIRGPISWVVLVLFAHSLPGGEVLPNGITLPEKWPPANRRYSREPRTVPYLLSLPPVIPIDLGRQLFVDDFLIESTTLNRRFHTATVHPASPVLGPDRPWEGSAGDPKYPPQAIPFSDGVWYDDRDQRFKLWYVAGAARATCYATSADGLHWDKPALDVVPGTNIVIPEARDSATVWIDPAAGDPGRRYVLHRRDNATNRHVVHFSRDGIHWGQPQIKAGAAEDRSTLFHDPFRRKWVFGLRSVHVGEAESASAEFVKDTRVALGVAGFTRVGRIRRYAEGDSLEALFGSWRYPDTQPRTVDGPFLRDSTSAATPLWIGSDVADAIRPDIGTPTELYNLDAVAYESLMFGLFSIWRGVPTAEPGRDKINEVCIGFSRDGFHWDRSSRTPLVGVSEDPRAWNFSNVQSAGGCLLVVGDRLHFYVSGRQTRDLTLRRGVSSTGLATLRRDGFAAMVATDRPGVLTTRPLRWSGRHLFVNVDCPQGALEVEVLDEAGKPVEPFTRANCRRVQVDSTRQWIGWGREGAVVRDLSGLAGRALRLRFHLVAGSLYSFWVAPTESGASQGYVGAGGPGFRDFRDLDATAAGSR